MPEPAESAGRPPHGWGRAGSCFCTPTSAERAEFSELQPPFRAIQFVISAVYRPKARKSRMAENEYVFIDRWRVEADVPEVADIIGDSEGLVRWWPSVYLEYRQLCPGGQSG